MRFATRSTKAGARHLLVDALLFVLAAGIAVWIALLHGKLDNLKHENRALRHRSDTLFSESAALFVLVNGTASNANSANTTVISSNSTNSCIDFTPGGNLTDNCTTAVYDDFYANSITVGSPVPHLSKRSVTTYDPAATVLQISNDMIVQFLRGFWVHNASSGEVFELTQRVAQFDQMQSDSNTANSSLAALADQIASAFNLVNLSNTDLDQVISQITPLQGQFANLSNVTESIIEQTVALVSEVDLLQNQTLGLSQNASALVNATTLLLQKVQNITQLPTNTTVLIQDGYNITNGFSLQLRYTNGSGLNISDSAPRLLRFAAKGDANAIITLPKVISTKDGSSIVLETGGWYDITINLIFCSANKSSQFYDWYVWVQNEQNYSTYPQTRAMAHGSRFGSSSNSPDDSGCFRLHYHRTLGITEKYLNFFTQFFPVNRGVDLFGPATNDGVSESYVSVVQMRNGPQTFTSQVTPPQPHPYDLPYYVENIRRINGYYAYENEDNVPPYEYEALYDYYDIVEIH